MHGEQNVKIPLICSELEALHPTLRQTSSL